MKKKIADKVFDAYAKALEKYIDAVGDDMPEREALEYEVRLMLKHGAKFYKHDPECDHYLVVFPDCSTTKSHEPETSSLISVKVTGEAVMKTFLS